MSTDLPGELARSTAEAPRLTHGQRLIWVGQQLHPESPLYNMAFAFVFTGDLNAELFRAAWQGAVEASDVLRTRLSEADLGAGEVSIAAAPTLQMLDFSSRDDADTAFRHWSLERCAEPLAMTGPLVDSVLVLLGGGRTGWYLNQHHLITDAWSTRLLYQQVAAQYQLLTAESGGAARATESTSSAPPPYYPPYYPTAAAGQSWAQGSADRQQAEDHWVSRQQRAGRIVRFYGQDSQPTTTVSHRWTLELDDRQSRALEQLTQQPGFRSLSAELSRFTLFATLLVSWLHRVSGSRDLGFDAPVAGRPLPQSKQALGLFIEVFPFAVKVHSGDSFRTLASHCLQEAQLFLRHALPSLSSPTGATASNVVLNYVPLTFGDFAGLPATVEWLHPGHGDSVHALRLQVHDFAGTGRWQLHFDANPALPEFFGERGLRHFTALLEALLDDPDQPIASVDVRTPAEVHALQTLNGTDSQPLPSQSVAELFLEQAASDPDRVALYQGTAELTFAQVRQQSEALAATLVARGIEPGDRVAILSPRSTAAVVAILAVMRARAAFVPLDPAVPPARWLHILKDCGARLVLAGESLATDAAALAQQLPEVVDVLPISQGVEAGSGLDLQRSLPELDDLAYLIYTSGSTGEPKGVLIEHGGLADYLQWAERQYVRGDRLRFALFTSMAFDLTVTSLFLPLITGGSLQIYAESGGAVDTAMMDVAEDNSVDFIKLTPSHLSVLERVGLAGSKVRRMVVGGEDLRTRLAASVSAQFDDRVEIYNEYGPTEAVVGCVMHRFDPAQDPAHDTATSVPIGVPADHVRVAILNADQTPVPDGVAGELWLARFGLARGYHRRSELTAERFQPRTDTGERWYRTGDLVRRLPSGSLEYLGRMDRQLKISGYRVEPGEIEAALHSLPTIEQCVVLARRHPAAAASQKENRHCVRCGLPSNYPRASFDDQGVCNICHSYEAIKDQAQAYFKTEEELRATFEESARQHGAPYDCMMLLSGGKDSTYALCRLVDMGLKVYAFSLDNGFIAEGAKENIRRVTSQLGVTVEFGQTPAMNAIFRDSLQRFANVCNGCFKTIYTLSMKRARELGIPIIVTGLSRGQMFETRLTEDLFRDGGRSVEEIDATVLAARKAYHLADDEVSRSLDVQVLREDQIFEDIKFVDFYRYCDVGMDEMYAYLLRQVPWARPKDTGRSTNCLINDAGIWVHKNERGFHNYALPYSWDVRLGHKTRSEAMAELDDDIDVENVEDILGQVGYDTRRATAGIDQTALEAFYVAPQGVSEQEIRQHLSERLPAQLIPVYLRRVDSIPLTASGKVDESALVRQSSDQAAAIAYRAPEGPVEEFLAEVWQQELWVEQVGADDNFFQLGGTSLSAIQVILRLCQEFAIDLPLDGMFSHPTLSQLAKVAEKQILADVEEMTEAEREQLEG